VIVGEGPEGARVRAQFQIHGQLDQLHLTGTLKGQDLADAYSSMDVFAFASKVETQGLVLTEAMAAGVPVVAIDAPGVRDVLRDRVNGRLLDGEKPEAFVEALGWAVSRKNRRILELGTAKTALAYSMESTGRELLILYTRLERQSHRRGHPDAHHPWSIARRRLREEWLLANHRAHALRGAWWASAANS
jgi:glycosyltransferase involved in cell wall biosynthesis